MPAVCLADDVLFAFATGGLGDAERASAEAHLRHCQDCRTVLAEVARSLAPQEEPDSDAGLPRQIGRYRLDALIGAGASAVVYRAFDRSLQRTVALKVLRPDLERPSADAKQRTLREAQAMAQLSHANVVAVFDAGMHDGRVYIVMEHVDGPTLSDWLKRESRAPREILRVFLDAGRGLSAAHHQGLVHRDFKPDNVLVGQSGRAKVTDFGLARLGERPVDTSALGEGSADAATLTRGLIGTPAYMAPELFDGALASPKSDQFSFCVALYTALFERHPYRAGEGIELSELVTRAKSEIRDEPTLLTRLQDRVLPVLRRGLSAEPASRFADMDALLGALERAPIRRGVRLLAWAPLVAAGVAAALWLLARSRLDGSDARPPPELAASQAVPQPVVAASARAQAEQQNEPAPQPVAPSLGKSPPAPELAPSARSRPHQSSRLRKSSEVRYRDGLKEPF